MTTKVTVDAHACPVLVTQQPGSVPNAYIGPPQTVPANTKQDFHVHSGVDLLIHEIQPGEVTESAPSD